MICTDDFSNIPQGGGKGKSRRDVGKGHGALPVFQRIADTPADEIHGGSEDSTLSKATEGRTSNCEQNGHREILLSLCLIGCDSMI